MKKIDKLIVGAFLGPFFLTFIVVVFILLTQYLLKYLDELVGKNLGFTVFTELIFYFSINMVPVALPLAVLLSSLMTFGNLGEHHELTALKGSGISFIRMLAPLIIIVGVLTVCAFYFNNTIVPKANLKAFSLLYDIRQKKPALDFKEGVFYEGLPGYRIKVSQKYPDGKSLKGVMIYDHRSGKGNTDLIIADSGIMQIFNHDKYLSLELFNGKSYSEYPDQQGVSSHQFVRNGFANSKMIFSLASFDLSRTREELFASNKLMKNTVELDKDRDSLKKEFQIVEKNIESNIKPFYSYYYTNSYPASPVLPQFMGKPLPLKDDSISQQNKEMILNRATNQARSVKSYTASYVERMAYMMKEINVVKIEKNKKFTQSLACLIMFLIGAPLGAIIKKGGFGVPVLISIFFFIVFYVLSIIGEKWSKEGVVSVEAGMWAANMILFPIGVFFLIQAKNDSRILEFDSIFRMVKGIFNRKKAL
ncbi:MAG TPA: LptF/LptG family permease [Cytophagaceae bacterium]|jgi:lipopolysaccharide export system permease protein